MTRGKQMKIPRMFQRAAKEIPEDHDELLTGIQELEQQVKEKHDELFQLQRNSYRHNYIPPKKKSEPFVRPQNIVLSNSVQTLKQIMGMMSMLTGMEVESYSEDDHCSIVFHLQHSSEHEIKHRLKILANNGQYEVLRSSLPIGFNLNAVTEGFNNVMKPQFLVAVRRALVAYYDRLEQFEHLKKLLKTEVKLFKISDGSHMEITFEAKSDHNPEAEVFSVTLMLDYRIFDIRPKQCSFDDIDLPEEVADALKLQCAVFKTKPLHKAFKEAFINGNGIYVMVRQIDVPQDERRRRAKPCPQRYHNDDTFLPEHCSQSEDSAESD